MNTLLEQILYQPPLNKRGYRKTIDEYAEGTFALFTPFDPLKPFEPVCGPWGPSESYQREQFGQKRRESNPVMPTEPMGFSIKPNSTRLFGEESEPPLLRIDRKAHHGLPKNHLQYGEKDYTGRYGDEAYDILGEVFKKSKRNILFPFDEDDKPW